MAQTFLAAGEQGSVIACFGEHDAIRVKPALRQTWCKQIRACDAPQHTSLCPRGDARREEDGGSAMDGPRRPAGDFMK